MGNQMGELLLILVYSEGFQFKILVVEAYFSSLQNGKNSVYLCSSEHLIRSLGEKAEWMGRNILCLFEVNFLWDTC